MISEVLCDSSYEEEPGKTFSIRIPDNTMNRFRSHLSASTPPLRLSLPLCLLAILVLIARPAAGDELVRVWVDWMGQHSIKATLVETQTDDVVLMTTDGRRILIPIDKLSENDQRYIEKVGQANVNILRAQPPQPPEIEPLPILDLPPAEIAAEKGAKLAPGSAPTVSKPTMLPAAIPADRVPFELAIAEQQFALEKLDSHDICSNLIPVGSAEAPALGISVSSGFSTPGQAGPVHRLLRLDAGTSKSEVIWSGAQRIRLFDHHLPSGRSLVLIGQNPLGQGGELAIATGWDRGAIFIRSHRGLPDCQHRGRSPQVRWARLIDDEHFLAIVDESLIAANIVSGQVLYRIDGIHRKSTPAISGGRRVVAIPLEGAVHLYRTEDGESLGRIGTESSIVPAVGFSHHGDSLALITSRRMRVWSLPDAALRADIETRRSLGSGSPTWIDSDLVMTSSGILISIFRGIPVWRYEIAGAITNYVGGNVAILRKHGNTDLSVVRLPHQGANSAMQWIDAIPTATNFKDWRVPGRSVWSDDGWNDHDVRVSAQSNQTLQR